MRRVVGHVTVVCLLRLPFLSFLHHTYKSRSKMGSPSCDLWPTVHHALRMLGGLPIHAYDVCVPHGLRCCGVWLLCRQSPEVLSMEGALACPEQGMFAGAFAAYVEFERASSDVHAEVPTVLPHDVSLEGTVNT